MSLKLCGQKRIALYGKKILFFPQRYPNRSAGSNNYNNNNNNNSSKFFAGVQKKIKGK